MNAHLVGDVAHITGEPAWNLDVFYNNLELVSVRHSFHLQFFFFALMRLSRDMIRSTF
jgi:hypothetical protein